MQMVRVKIENQEEKKRVWALLKRGRLIHMGPEAAYIQPGNQRWA